MTEDRKGVDGHGPAARKARRNAIRNERRRAAKNHGVPMAEPEETTVMVIPEHIRALAEQIEEGNDGPSGQLER